MKQALIKLLKVKSIITIILTLTVCYLALINRIEVKEIYLIIIGFYFGTQNNNKENDSNT